MGGRCAEVEVVGGYGLYERRLGGRGEGLGFGGCRRGDVEGGGGRT